MPLIKGDSKSSIKKNFHEFRKGPTFKKTENKFGKKKALAQMDAAVLSTAKKVEHKREARKRG